MLDWLKNKKHFIIYLVGVLFLSTGLSYAYFVATSSVSGDGSFAQATTATVASEGVLADGNINVSEIDIYPGHKTISSIRVTGRGSNIPLIYHVIFNGTNTFETDINYKVYKTTSNISASYTCNKEQSVVDGAIRYYESCTGTNIDELGEVIASGTINKGESKTTLISDEILLTTENGNVVYYYVEIEYPNNDESQNSDMDSVLSGSITVEESSNEYVNPNILFTASTTAGSNNWYKSVNITTNITTHTGNYEVLYCTTTSSSCTPNTTPTISNNSFNVNLSNNKSSQRICVKVTDEYNQVTEGCSDAYNVDNANPSTSVTLASSTSGSNGWYKAASIKATGSDSHSGVTSIQYCTTTSSSCTPNTNSSGSSATVTLNSNASGQRVCARAIDKAGNTGSTSCSSAYSVDKTNPTISITSTSVTDSSITVNVSASDSHSGIYQYKFSSNNGSSYTTVTSSSGSYSYTFENLNDDTTYTIAVQAVDRAGNTSSKVTRSVTTEKKLLRNQIIALNYAGFYVIKNNGTIWELTNNNYSWSQIRGITDAAAITASGYGLFVIKNDGTVWTNSGSDNVESWSQINGITDAVAISCTSFGVVLVVKSDGTIWMNTNDNENWSLITGFTDAVFVSATIDGLAAVKSDGTVWSSNDSQNWYQEEITDVISVSADTRGLAALKSDGTVWSSSDSLDWYQEEIDNVVSVSNIILGTAGFVKNDGTVWTNSSSGWEQLPNINVFN